MILRTLIAEGGGALRGRMPCTGSQSLRPQIYNLVHHVRHLNGIRATGSSAERGQGMSYRHSWPQQKIYLDGIGLIGAKGGLPVYG